MTLTGYLNQFDQLIGIDRIKLLHINDSKNMRGAGKDCHENIGFGEIGFETLNIYHDHPHLRKCS